MNGLNCGCKSTMIEWSISAKFKQRTQILIDTREGIGWRPTINLSRFVSLFVCSFPFADLARFAEKFGVFTQNRERSNNNNHHSICLFHINKLCSLLTLTRRRRRRFSSHDDSRERRTTFGAALLGNSSTESAWRPLPAHYHHHRLSKLSWQDHFTQVEGETAHFGALFVYLELELQLRRRERKTG